MRKYSPKKRLPLRIIMIFSVFTLLFITIILRAFQLQIIERDRLTQLIEKQYLKYVKLPPKRGTIYDRKKRELAVSIEVDSVYARPGKIKNKRETNDDALRRILFFVNLEMFNELYIEKDKVRSKDLEINRFI